MLPTTHDRVYVRTAGALLAYPYDSAGRLGEYISSTASATLSAGRETIWFLPGGRVAEGAGGVFDARDLVWRGFLHGRFRTLAVDREIFFVLREDSVTLHDERLHELGVVALAAPAREIFAFGGRAFVFRGTAEPELAEVVTYRVDDFAPRTPVEPSPPDLGPHSQLEFALDDDGVLHVAVREAQQLERYALDERTWLPSRGLTGEPIEVLHAPGSAFLRIAYSNGRTVRVPLEGGPEQQDLSLTTCGFVAVGDQLLACSFAGQVALYATFGEEDAPIDVLVHPPYSLQRHWNPAKRRLHQAAFGSPASVSWIGIDPSGAFGEVLRRSSGAWTGRAFAVSEDGSRVLMGTVLLDGDTLDPVGSLGESTVAAAVYVGDELVTVTEQGGILDLAVRSVDLEVIARARFPGTLPRLLTRGNRIALIAWNGSEIQIRGLRLDDVDGDGFENQEDAFPDDSTEWSDRDADRVGDNTDAFPDDASEWRDRDGDGVGDNADAFPRDPTRWSDRDRDGVADEDDAFPDDPREWVDSDQDGVGDNRDAFPHDWRYASDRDFDGVADEIDAFPDASDEWSDFDRDGIGDNGDRFPIGEPMFWLPVEGKHRLVLSRIGYMEGRLGPWELALTPEGTWSGCVPGACLFGTWQKRGRADGRRFDLQIDPLSLQALELSLEASADAAAGSQGSAVDFRSDTLRFSLELGRGGNRAKLRMQIEHDSRIAGFASGSGKYKWKVKRSDVSYPQP